MATSTTPMEETSIRISPTKLISGGRRGSGRIAITYLRVSDSRISTVNHGMVMHYANGNVESL